MASKEKGAEKKASEKAPEAPKAAEPKEETKQAPPAPADPSSDLTEIKTNWEESVESFDQLNLREELLRGIYGYGFERPSVIQQKGILPLLRGKDTIAQAQSGTGKTGTFAISALQVIDTAVSQCQVLILAPTRELAHQIQKVNSS